METRYFRAATEEKGVNTKSIYTGKPFLDIGHEPDIVLKITGSGDLLDRIERAIVDVLHKEKLQVNEEPKIIFDQYEKMGHFHTWSENNLTQCKCGARRCRAYRDNKSCGKAGVVGYPCNTRGSIMPFCAEHDPKPEGKDPVYL